MHGRAPLWLSRACDLCPCYASNLPKLYILLNVFMIQRWLKVVMIQVVHKIYY